MVKGVKSYVTDEVKHGDAEKMAVKVGSLESGVLPRALLASCSLGHYTNKVPGIRRCT